MTTEYTTEHLRKHITKMEKEFAKQIFKELYPDSTLSVMSGHSAYFDRFKKLARKILDNKLDNVGKLS